MLLEITAGNHIKVTCSDCMRHFQQPNYNKKKSQKQMGVKDHAVLQIQRRTRVSELGSGEASPGLPEPSCTIGSSWFLLDVCYLEGGGSRHD